MHVPLDYDTLHVIWWALLGLLLIGFAVFDGFDLGTAILLPFEPIARRARLAGMIASVVTLTLFALGGVYAYLVLAGYDVASVIAANAPSNPLRKSVEIATAGWMRNYERYPWTADVPILGLAGCLLASLMFARRRETGAFLASAIAVAGIVATPGVAMFPFIMPSSANPNVSLTVWDASSSHLTLFIMLVAVAIFLPMVLGYTAWVYRLLRGKVPSHIFEPGGHAY